jgi:hypothetical protein
MLFVLCVHSIVIHCSVVYRCSRFICLTFLSYRSNWALVSLQVPGQRKDDPNATAKLIFGAIYVLFGMAILAMCFDLMQEEIVAKFRWIGRKIGIIEKDEDQSVVPTSEKASNDNINANRTDPRRFSTVSNNAYRYPMRMQDRTLEYNDGNDWPTKHDSSGTRKSSPRNNTARVHPMMITSNEGTLYQRTSSAKQTDGAI